MQEIYSLLTKDINDTRTGINGILQIMGNTEKNWIKLLFTFSESSFVVPVVVKLYDGYNFYTYLCSVQQTDSLTVRSSLFICDFLISEKFFVYSVEPLVEYIGAENDKNTNSSGFTS